MGGTSATLSFSHMASLWGHQGHPVTPGGPTHFPFSNGTTINMLPMDALEMPLLVVPPLELVKKFTALAEAAHLQVEANKQQSRTLATLRDTLLPKLLSGEITIKP